MNEIAPRSHDPAASLLRCVCGWSLRSTAALLRQSSHAGWARNNYALSGCHQRTLRGRSWCGNGAADRWLFCSFAPRLPGLWPIERGFSASPRLMPPRTRWGRRVWPTPTFAADLPPPLGWRSPTRRPLVCKGGISRGERIF